LVCMPIELRMTRKTRIMTTGAGCAVWADTRGLQHRRGAVGLACQRQA
jgi:hypothetical protein